MNLKRRLETWMSASLHTSGYQYPETPSWHETRTHCRVFEASCDLKR